MGRLLCLLLVSLLIPIHDAAAQQVKLRANLQVSTSDRFIGESVVRFKQEVERESKGAVVIEIIDKAKSYHDDEVLAAVASGAVDIGIEGLDRIGDKVLAADFIDEPFLFNFPALRKAAVAPDSEIRQLIDVAILAETGVRVLWWESLGSTVVFSKGRDVTDPARMKGQRVGAPSAILAEFAARCGAKASEIALEKLPEALKAGQIDMILAELDALETDELWRVADTITRVEHAPAEAVLIINERVWQSLTPEHRAMLTKVATNIERDTRKTAEKAEADSYALAVAKGMKVHDLKPDDVADWRACSAEMLTDYLNKVGPMGERLTAAYRKLRASPCCTAPPAGSHGFTRR